MIVPGFEFTVILCEGQNTRCIVLCIVTELYCAVYVTEWKNTESLKTCARMWI